MEEMANIWTVQSIGPIHQIEEKKAVDIVVLDDTDTMLNYSLQQTPCGETYLIDETGDSIISVEETIDIEKVKAGDKIVVSVSIKENLQTMKTTYSKPECEVIKLDSPIVLSVISDPQGSIEGTEDIIL